MHRYNAALQTNHDSTVLKKLWNMETKQSNIYGKDKIHTFCVRGYIHSDVM